MNRKEKIPVAAVVGPTASGKSRLAVELALSRNGEVISADSMQIYKGMDIGTAKPTAEEMRGVPHHLIDFAPLSQPFSVADYVSLASDCISEVHARGRLPVIAGGTGLYIRSLLQNIRFTENDKDEALRKELAEKVEKLGVQTLIDELRSFDPASAQRIHPNNLGRVIRAIEIYRTTGVTMTEQLELSRQMPSPYDACIIGLDFQDRQKLYDRINLRVDWMMQDGLLAEAEEILNRPGAQTAMQAIGYKELLPYFRSECSLDEAVESVKRESRRYAKRQLTWFRRDENIHWIMVDEYTDFDGVTEQAFRMIDRKGWER
ncbi:tRNA (adenosine(37)-N6)-dimethylallyltransferase MiaA [Caproiciproducens sp. R1]|uniref:tRNA (adenosine(37)-N6)-dimethylallyltransferase MiaA n=1 Tax=Caproiciproducens sp. R1 TaxID=3435000 RepID=UPI0040343C91